MIKNDNYIVLQGWMINELKLSGNELIVFAVIYGFSQDGESVFNGSRKYLANCCNCEVRTVDNILVKLIDKGFITKYVNTVNGVKFCEYAANFPRGEKITPGGSEKISPNNTSNNKLENNNTSTKVEVGKSTTTKKLSLYEKCAIAIDEYTNSGALKEALTNYLTYRLSVKDKPIYLAQWKALLKKLDTFNGELVSIVNTSLENGWLSFYEPKDKYKKSDEYKSEHVFSEYNSVVSNKVGKDERKRLNDNARKF